MTLGCTSSYQHVLLHCASKSYLLFLATCPWKRIAKRIPCTEKIIAKRFKLITDRALIPVSRELVGMSLKRSFLNVYVFVNAVLMVVIYYLMINHMSGMVFHSFISVKDTTEFIIINNFPKETIPCNFFWSYNFSLGIMPSLLC